MDGRLKAFLDYMLDDAMVKLITRSGSGPREVLHVFSTFEQAEGYEDIQTMMDEPTEEVVQYVAGKLGYM